MKKLIKLYQERGITTCELGFINCWYNNTLAFAHRHKRRWYKGQGELLSTFEQTILVCSSCHQKIEYDPDLTEEVFEKLRGPES